MGTRSFKTIQKQANSEYLRGMGLGDFTMDPLLIASLIAKRAFAKVSFALNYRKKIPLR